MSRSLITLAALSIAVATPFISLQAQAVQRTHVSAAFGSDANTATNCAAAAPCRFFTAAMSVTNPNGEVIVLDSGGYGAVTITQSVALIAPTGVYAGISVFPGADGVTIATAGVNVVLRGLSINGQGGNSGIYMTAGNRLTVENCVISNLGQYGISVNTAATVRVTDSIVRDNGASGITLQNGVKATITRAVVSGNVGNVGIFLVGNTPSTSTVDIADSTVDGNFYGIYARSTVSTAILKLSVRDSRILRNLSVGLGVESNAGAAASLYASNNMVSNNRDGLFVYGAAAKVISTGNTVTGNTRAGFYAAGVFESAGNNTVRDNGAANVGTITVIAAQ